MPIIRRCVAELRNSGRTAKLLLKYLNGPSHLCAVCCVPCAGPQAGAACIGIMHVYVNQNPGRANSYKFCLAVQLGLDLSDHHLAVSAATGQVADTHELTGVTTRSANLACLTCAFSLRGHERTM